MLRIRECCACAVIVLTGLLTGTASAQNDGPGDAETIMTLARQVEELQAHARELQDRIRSLQSQQTPVPLESAPVADHAPTEPASRTNDQSLSNEMHNFHGFHWRGFGELNYKVLDQRTPELGTYGFVPGSAGNFYTADFDLFLTSRLSEKARVLSEIDFEEQDAQRFKVDLRRILFKYDQSDYLRFSFGRYQTEIGYYNWAFRSASWLQTAADRPLVMEFAADGGLLPTQAIGVSVTGAVPSGSMGLNYVAEYGSSDTMRPDINGDGFINDENNGNHVNFGVFLTPDRVPGLRLGGSIYHDQISDIVLSPGGEQLTGEGIPSSSERWNQTIFNAHVVYVAREIELLNEGFLIRHAPTGTGTIFNTPAFYSQLSRKLGKVRPFVRYQYVNASERNTIYDDFGLRHGPSFGVRYDLVDYLAFKVQLDRTFRRDLPAINGLHLQLSGTF